MTDETINEPSAHARRVAEEEAERTGRDQDQVRTDHEQELVAEQAGKRWEKLDAEDPDVMDEARDEPPPAGYNPRSG